MNNIQEILQQATLVVAGLAETGAALVIGFAALQAIFQSIGVFIKPNPTEKAKENIRLNLARWLSLGLEFEVAADILRTAITPSWNDIGQLAAIVALRTVLNYFIQKEIDRATSDESANA